MSRPPKNYRWWQDHGHEWADEVARRKAQMPIYHLQEIFLSRAPAGFLGIRLTPPRLIPIRIRPRSSGRA